MFTSSDRHFTPLLKFERQQFKQQLLDRQARYLLLKRLTSSNIVALRAVHQVGRTYSWAWDIKLCITTLYVLVYGKTLLHFITILLPSMNGGDHRCGDTVGWDTVLQVRKSQIRFLMASLEYFTDLILLATIWPRGQLSLYRNEYQQYFLGGYRWLVQRADNLTTFMY